MSDTGSRAIFRRLAVNSAYLAAGTIASAAFLMLAAVLNARSLSTHEFGVLVLFQSATLLLSTFMSFATQQPVIKLGSTALADGDFARLGRIIALALAVDTAAAVATSVIAFAILHLGRSSLGLTEDLYWAGTLFAWSLLFTGFLSANGIFRLFNRFGLFSSVQAACAALLLAVTGYLYSVDAPFSAYCWTWAIYYAVNSQLPLLVALSLVRQAGVPLGFGGRALPPTDVRTFFAYCWTTWGTGTIEGLRSNGDSLLVGALVSVQAAGIYNVAKQLAGIFRKFNAVYTSAAFPEISALAARGEDSHVRLIRNRMLAIGGVVGFGAVATALLAGKPVLGLLFGPEFRLGWIALVILTAAAAAQLISHTFSMFVQVYVGPGAVLRAYLLAVLPVIVAVVPLTYAFSMAGTAFAQVLFSAALAFFCYRTLRTADAG